MNIESCDLTNNFRRAISAGSGDIQIRKSNLFGNHVCFIRLKNSFCDAKYNWWGSKLGPLFSYGFRLQDMLKRDSGRLKYFPWNLNPYQNAGSDWNVNDIFQKTIVKGYEDAPIEFSGNDTDDDGLPDWWEEIYEDFDPNIWEDHINIDNDGDGLNNYEECYAYGWGADPSKKDVFLEFDWTPSELPDSVNKPPENLIEEMKQRFEEHNINLHVDLGNLGGGEEMPYISDFDFNKLTDLYWDYFLHNDLNNPRKNIFHYGLVCDRGPLAGFAIVGWGHLNGFCVSASILTPENPTRITRGRYITTGSMHELGHTLGLFVDDFEGIDNCASSDPFKKEFLIYRNYKSTMNYRYTYDILDYSDGDNGRVDYNDWANIELDFFKNSHFEWPKD